MLTCFGTCLWLTLSASHPQALTQAMTKHRRVGSRVLVCQNRVPVFLLDAAPVAMRLVTVEPRVVLSSCAEEWIQVSKAAMSPRVSYGLGAEAEPLFDVRMHAGELREKVCMRARARARSVIASHVSMFIQM